MVREIEARQDAGLPLTIALMDLDDFGNITRNMTIRPATGPSVASPTLH